MERVDYVCRDVTCLRRNRCDKQNTVVQDMTTRYYVGSPRRGIRCKEFKAVKTNRSSYYPKK